MDSLALIDFEASCLPENGQSFPIEVALARTDGSSHTWFIRPAPAWRYWDWDPEAEALHGISLDQLHKDGMPAAQVLSEMADFVGTANVYADADLDAYWLELLAHAAGKPMPFHVHFLGEYFVERGFTRPQVVEALEAAKAYVPREHIARDDARRLAVVVRLLNEGGTGAA